MSAVTRFIPRWWDRSVTDKSTRGCWKPWRISQCMVDCSVTINGTRADEQLQQAAILAKGLAVFCLALAIKEATQL